MESFTWEIFTIMPLVQPIILEYIVKKYSSLKRFSLRFLILHEDEMRQTESSLSSVALITKLVGRVESLHINLCVFNYIINSVDLASVNIKELNLIIDCCHHSNMFTTAQGRSLMSLTSLSVPTAQYMDLLNGEVTLPNLKPLVLYRKFSRGPRGIITNLDLLLKVWPLLETLEIFDSVACISIEDINRRHYLSLRTLKLTVFEVELRAFRYIRTSLPNINNLKLFTYSQEKWEGFQLPEHDLHVFGVNIFVNRPTADWINYYYVITSGNRRKFKFSRTNFINRHVKELSNDEWKRKSKYGSQVIKLTCNTLFELKENGTVIF